MRHHSSSAKPSSSDNAALRLVRRQARRLHKAVLSDSLSASLPVLRRLLATAVLTGLSLPQLQQQRDIVQRKHLFQMLAIEAGYDSWEHYRTQLAILTPNQLEHYDILRSQKGQLNHWFSTPHEAERYAQAYGGRAVAVGGQAVVVD